jgi:integrase
VLAISTGMRQGELLGLRWEDVDVKPRRMQLVRQLKTRQSRRAVVLSYRPQRRWSIIAIGRPRSASSLGCAGRSMAWS